MSRVIKIDKLCLFKNVLAWKRVLSENELKDHYKSPVKYFNTTV